MSNSIGKKLYRLNQNNVPTVWFVDIDDGTFVIHNGIVNGSLVERFVDESYESIEKRYKDKLNNGYVFKPDNITEAEFVKTLSQVRTDVNDVRKPMKAQPYVTGCMQFPVIGQPKINGVRCVAQWVSRKGTDLFDPDYEGFVLLSKEGHEYPVQHIIDQLNDIVKKEPYFKNYVYDGELFCANTKVAVIAGAARNVNNSIHHKLSFIMFDLSDIGDQVGRLLILDSVPVHHLGFYQNVNDITPSTVYKLSSTLIASNKQVLSYRDVAINNNYEGIILRDMNAEYGFGKRVKTMRKLKREMFDKFTIVDIVPRNESDGLPLFILRNDLNDNTFESSCNGSHGLQRSILENKAKYIGTTITVKYYERTENLIPFHTTVMLIDNE